MIETPVLVIGAGMCGLLCALGLSNEVMCVDRLGPPKPRKDHRAVILSHHTLTTLRQAGYTIPTRYDIEQLCITQTGHQVCHVKAKRLGQVALGEVLDMASLMTQWRKQCPVHWQYELISLSRLTNGWEVGFKTPKGEQLIRANHLVAADGHHSKVRKLLGLAALNTYADYSSWVVPVRYHPRSTCALVNWLPGACVAFLPYSAEAASVVWTGQSLPKDWADQVLAMWPELAIEIGTSSPQAYPVVSHKMPRTLVPQVSFIGNARYSMPPVAAQGLNAGLQDALLVSQALSNNQVPKLSSARRRRLLSHAPLWAPAGIHYLPDCFFTSLFQRM